MSAWDYNTWNDTQQIWYRTERKLGALLSGLNPDGTATGGIPVQVSSALPAVTGVASEKGKNVTVGTSSTSLLATNAAARERTVQNNSTGTQLLYLSFSGTATAVGLCLRPGDSWTSTNWGGLVSAISDQAGAIAGVTEV